MILKQSPVLPATDVAVPVPDNCCCFQRILHLQFMGQKTHPFWSYKAVCKCAGVPASIPAKQGSILPTATHQPGAYLQGREYMQSGWELYRTELPWCCCTKANRIWKIPHWMRSLDNVGFADGDRRSRIIFAAGEVSEIWITFPDPQVAVLEDEETVNAPSVLRLYRQILKAGGTGEPEDRTIWSTRRSSTPRPYGELDNVYQSG